MKEPDKDLVERAEKVLAYFPCQGNITMYNLIWKRITRFAQEVRDDDRHKLLMARKAADGFRIDFEKQQLETRKWIKEYELSDKLAETLEELNEVPEYEFGLERRSRIKEALKAHQKMRTK